MLLLRRISSSLAARCYLLAILSSACLTPILHTPHVDPGQQVSLAMTLSSGLVTGSGDSVKKKWLQAPLPSISARESFGFRAANDSGRPALALAVQASAIGGPMADAYLEAPQRWTGATDLGVGVADVELGYHGLGAYLQVGHKINKHAYIFTTQSVWNVVANDGPGRRMLWQPTVAVQRRPPDERAGFAFLTMTLGPTAAHCPVILGCLAAGPAALLVIGISTPSYPFP